LLVSSDKPVLQGHAVGGDRLFLAIDRYLVMLSLADLHEIGRLDLGIRSGSLMATRGGDKVYVGIDNPIPVAIDETGRFTVGDPLPFDLDVAAILPTTPRKSR
jgi:hypothetical protein